MSPTFEVKNPVDGCTLRGEIHAPKAPRAMLSIVHGFGEHQGRYAPMIAFLNGHDIAVCTLDLRGHGLSEGPRGVCKSYDLMLSDVTVLLEQAKAFNPDIPQFLYGHSMGGGLVLSYGLRRDIKDISGVIASAPLLSLPKPPPAVLEFVINMLCKIAPSMTIKNSIGGDQVSTLPDEQAAYESDPLNHDRLGVRLAQGMFENGEYALSHVGDWTKPLLLMHARNDKLTAFSGSEAFAAKAANCTFMPLENVEHEIHNDSSRDAVYSAMLKFMEPAA